VRGYLAAGSTVGVLKSSTVAVAAAPSEDAEWRLVAAGSKPDGKSKKGQAYVLSVPARSAALTVKDGKPALGAEGTPLRLRHVRDDNPRDGDRNGTRCASWPEIDPGATGKPKPSGRKPTSPVKGLFESHIHGMAFEFLGGELRCGRPWHEYGVEFALGSCDNEKNSPNRVLEVPLGGNAPDYTATYDPQGWPTFKSWPRNRTLTHEQFYWRWLERAHAGGLRMLTNLLVENRALCEQYPIKKNSCNEMDSVRLQAKRVFELQDYIDAQNGGPGEGWYRVVSTPAQARQVIHAGRLAVLLGVENSALFDCEEKLYVPQCTKEQIDDRLQEIHDMGVRQVQLVNKFDNALAGVTGDPGTTGQVVNSGNRYITGHYWDMLTCNEDNDGHDHKHPNDLETPQAAVDRQQISAADGTPAGAEGVDALAGRILDTAGMARTFVAPAYGPGPHCNSRGLTDLGAHALRGIVAKGMIFDPDHMSARAQLQALDLLQREIPAEERARAKKEGRPAVKPSVISSHSWSNDVGYQRIYELDGVVAPYANEPTRYVDDWVKLRRYAAKQAPRGYQFGMGYGADTNGLGGQPPPRQAPKKSLKYTANGFPALIGGIRLKQHRSGLRTFDVTKEGVAMYGLFADWVQEVALAADERAAKTGGGKQIVADMLNGAETYLQLWERAVYGVNSCVTDQSSLQLDDLHALLGGNVEGFLDAAGQPADRTDDAYVYCVKGADDQPVAVDVVFDRNGKATEVRRSTSSVQPVPTGDPADGHDGHDGHDHGLTPELPRDGELALGALLVLGLTGLGTGTLTGRRRIG
jgi:microsomal dipeptidase-like Zn-dependent dipeptidase